jgi:hypothetical protein
MDLPGVEDLYDDITNVTPPTDIPPQKRVPAPKKFSRTTLNDRLQELEMLKNKGRGTAKKALNDEVTRDKEGVKGMSIPLMCDMYKEG